MNNPNLPEDSIRDIYNDGRYLSANPTWHSERAPWKAGQVATGLRAAGLAPTSMCDIGCGTGLALAEVVKRVPSITRAVGFEPAEAVPRAPEIEGVAEIRRGYANESNERFDCTMMLDVFEHVEDCFGLLRACAPLAPNHVFHIPLDASALAIIRSDLMSARRKVGHLHNFTRETALATLEETGHEVLHWHYTRTFEGAGTAAGPAARIVRKVVLGMAPELGRKVIGGLSLLVVTAHPAGKDG